MRVGLGGISGTNILSIGRGVSIGGGGGEVCTPVDQIDGNVAEGTTFTHPADGVVAWDVDALPTNRGYAVRFRIQDSQNYWESLVLSSGVLQLYEVVSGSYTSRATGGSVLGKRVAIVLDGNTITAYVNGSQIWSYGSASNFATQTNGTANDSAPASNGAISDLKTWTLACRGEEGV